jgi:hypothetical protein
MHARVQFCDHVTALAGCIHSAKPDPVERQLEKFMQASTMLRWRDLGLLLCDIKFSELTYLDAFWRDYTNGTLRRMLTDVLLKGTKLIINFPAISFDGLSICFLIAV